MFTLNSYTMDSKTSHIVSHWFEKKYQEIDQQLAQLPTQCAKGCDWCCYQSIEILEWEEPLIMEYVDHQLSEKQKNRIKKRLVKWFDYFDENVPNRPQLTIEDIFVRFQLSQGDDRKPCVFLEKHECMIYPVRPICCRTHVVNQQAKGCIDNPLRDAMAEAENIRISVVNDIIKKIPTSLKLLNFSIARLFELTYRTRPIESQILEAL